MESFALFAKMIIITITITITSSVDELFRKQTHNSSLGIEFDDNNNKNNDNGSDNNSNHKRRGKEGAGNVIPNPSYQF